MELINKVKETIKDYNLISHGERVLVGVSGGPDSIALLHVLHRLKGDMGITIHAAHMNHSFRGKQADDEALWVQEKSREWGIDCTIVKEDVPGLAKELGLSSQDAGHMVRMRFFNELSKKIHANKIALAHHANDQAETILVNLVSGAGLEGLRGMLPYSDMIIRPLLYVCRDNIEEYCQENKLEPRRDPSNKKNIYLRNKIRNQLIPWISENINPNIVQSLNRTARVLAAEEELLENETNKIFKKYVVVCEGKIVLDLRKWGSIPLAYKRRLIRSVYQKISEKQGPSFHHVEEVRDLADKKSVGKVIELPYNVKVEKGYNNLYFSCGVIEKKNVVKIPDRLIKIPGETLIPEKRKMITAEVSENAPIFRGKEFVYIPINNDEYPKLIVRTRRPGDRFSPKGMRGTKKLKEYFIDKKIPQKERDDVLLIAEKDKVIWIPDIAFGEMLNKDKEGCKYLILKISQNE